MIENFLAGSSALFGDPITILIFVFGVIGGMLFGAIPGVSMLTLAAICYHLAQDLSQPRALCCLRYLLYWHLWGCNHGYLFNIPGARKCTNRL